MSDPTTRVIVYYILTILGGALMGGLVAGLGVLRTPSKRTLHRPSAPQSVLERIAVDAGFLRPRFKSHGPAIAGYQDVPTSVAHLLSMGCPPTVFSAVAKRVVEAVERVPRRRSRPHVGVEAIEGIPFWADGDPAPTVMLIGSATRLQATATQLNPGTVLGGFSREPMGGVLDGRRFPLQAAARLCRTVSECGASDGDGPAAITPADPAKITASRLLLSATLDRQPTKSFAGLMGDTIPGYRDLLSRGVVPRDVCRIAGASSCLNFTRGGACDV